MVSLEMPEIVVVSAVGAEGYWRVDGFIKGKCHC